MTHAKNKPIEWVSSSNGPACACCAYNHRPGVMANHDVTVDGKSKFLCGACWDNLVSEGYRFPMKAIDVRICAPSLAIHGKNLPIEWVPPGAGSLL